MTFFTEIEKNHMEASKTLKSQSNLQQKKSMTEVSQYLISNYTIESCNKNGMELPQKQTHRTMECPQI
jgi:hypothetical protein